MTVAKLSGGSLGEQGGGVLLHYTLNTGHTRKSPRHEVADDVIAKLSPLMTLGEHEIPGMPGYWLDVFHGNDCGGGLLCMVLAGADRRHCAAFAVAPNDLAAERLWPEFQAHYHEVTEERGFRAADFALAKRPALTPWCAVITTLATPTEAIWIADLERCVAWCWILREGDVESAPTDDE